MCRAGPLVMPANWTTAANLTTFYGNVSTGKERGNDFGVDEWYESRKELHTSHETMTLLL